MKLATRKKSGSGESAVVKKVRHHLASSTGNKLSDFMPANCQYKKSLAKRERLSLHGVLMRQFKHNEQNSQGSGSGQSLVEFALVLPVLILIIYGVFDLGRAFYALVTVANASREGARYMTTHITVMDTSINNSKKLVIDQVKKEALGSGIVLADSAITVDCVRALDSGGGVTPNCASGQDAWVKVSYSFAPLFSSIFPTSIPIIWETRMMIP